MMMLTGAVKLDNGMLTGDHELVCLCCGESRRFHLRSVESGQVIDTGNRRSPLTDPRAAAMDSELWRVSKCGRCGSPSISVSYVGDHGSLVGSGG